jgi:nitrogen fixation protein FixH
MIDSLTGTGAARSRVGLRGLHVLLIFIGFFLTVFVVNGIMIYKAESTFGGLETADAYRKGLTYNARIAEAEAQDRQGWHDTVAHVPETQRVRLSLTDRSGAPLPGLLISSEIGRPATDRFDRRLDFAQTGPGTYEADVAGLAAGWWIVDLEARKSEAAEVLYEAKERVWIKP